MLIEFRVTNFRSIRETQVLSMVANKDKTHLATNCLESGSTAAPYLTRSAVLYGANASGKTNLVAALGFMRSMVEQSAVQIREGQLLNVSPFKLDAESAKTSSEFEVTFIEDGLRYQYGFGLTRERITSEWLLAYPGQKAQRWFEREYDAATGKDEWYFSSFLTGQRRLWQESTRTNALFLSTAVNLNSEQLRPIYNWFINRVAVIDASAPLVLNFTLNQIANEAGRNRVMQFLNAADLAIADVAVETKKGQTVRFNLEIGKSPSQSITETDIKIPKFYHQRQEGGEKVEFDLSEESSGTRQLFILAGPILDVLENGRVLVVDELNNALHPLMVRYLVKLMHNPDLNRNQAQLIFTTHDTSLLDVDLFRRDQIWFVEKDRTQVSHFYPLTDFSPRKGEALEKGYLMGRYGAIPFFGELRL